MKLWCSTVTAERSRTRLGIHTVYVGQIRARATIRHDGDGYDSCPPIDIDERRQCSMKVLQSRWVGIAVPVAGVIGAVSTVVWVDAEARLKMVTALGVLVVTRYVIRWIYEYGSLMNRDRYKEMSRSERAERRLVWLFQSHLTDHNERGAQNHPVHIKLDTFDLHELSGRTQRNSEHRAEKTNPVPAEVPEWWRRRMP